jgi:hypothetical protein
MAVGHRIRAPRQSGHLVPALERLLDDAPPSAACRPEDGDSQRDSFVRRILEVVAHPSGACCGRQRRQCAAHACSIRAHDYIGFLRDTWSGVLRHDIVEFLAPIKGQVYKGFDEWHR